MVQTDNLPIFHRTVTLTPSESKFLSLHLSFQSIHKTHNVLLHLFIESTQFLIGQAVLGFILIELILHLLREQLALLVILLHKCRIIKHLGRQFCFLLTDIITKSCAVYLVSTVLSFAPFGILDFTLIGRLTVLCFTGDSNFLSEKYLTAILTLADI